jgi:hypothetical protein
MNSGTQPLTSVGVPAEAGFFEGGVRAEVGPAEVGACGKVGSAKISTRVETCVVKESFDSKFDATEVDVLVESGRAEVGASVPMKLFESDTFRKPDTAKIVVFRRLLFIERCFKVRRFLIARIVQHAVALALFFPVEPLARAGIAHIFFAVAYERVGIALFRWLLCGHIGKYPSSFGLV